MVKRDPLVFVKASKGYALVVISKDRLMTAAEAPLRHARWRGKASKSADPSFVWPSNEQDKD